MKEFLLLNGFNIAAFMLALLIIGYVILGGGLKSFHRRVFLYLLLHICLSSLLAMISWSMQPFVKVSDGQGVLWYVRKIIDCAYFGVHITEGAFFTFHLGTYLGTMTWRKRSVYFWYLFPLVVVYALILIDPFFNVLFTYVPVDGVYVYQRGPFMLLIYLFACAYFVQGAAILFIYRKGVSTKLRVKLLFLYLCALVGLAVQGINENIQIEIFCEMLAASGLLLLIEDRDKDVEAASLALNRNALIADFRRLILTEHRFTAIHICLDNISHYVRVLSVEDRTKMFKVIVDFLKKNSGAEDVYRSGLSSFLFMLDGQDEKRVQAAIDKIHAFFANGVKIDDSIINLAATVAIVRVPDEIPTLDALFQVLELPENLSNRDFVVVQGEGLAFAKRRLAVEKAIRTAIRKNSFTLYYQPIYNPNTKSMDYAEALVRLFDPEAGEIPPAEFIPIAEKCGLICEVGRQLFLEACEFIESIDMKKCGLEFIEVNLSPLQLYCEGLAQDFLAMMEEHHVDPHHINLEVTEAVALKSSKICRENVAMLMEKGVTFSLDDFGSGYANFQTLAALDFNNIKVDMDILRLIKTDSSAKRVYEAVVKSLRDDVAIIQEGVETKEELDYVLDINPAMRIQGFYFSKPLPAKDFLDYLKDFKANPKE